MCTAYDSNRSRAAASLLSLILSAGAFVDIPVVSLLILQAQVDIESIEQVLLMSMTHDRALEGHGMFTYLLESFQTNLAHFVDKNVFVVSWIVNPDLHRADPSLLQEILDSGSEEIETYHHIEQVVCCRKCDIEAPADDEPGKCGSAD